MARSVHAFVRASTASFYEWLGSTRAASLPSGPPVWICGDAHVGNFGPIASHRGDVTVGIRDLDQTVRGNPAHDVLRLAVSLATLVRSSNLPGTATARMIEGLAIGYRDALDGGPKGGNPPAIQFALKAAQKRSFRHLWKERAGSEKPRQLPIGSHFWPLQKQERAEVERLVRAEAVRRLVTILRERDDDADVELVDAAFWVKGCSSLGGLRAAAIVSVDGGLALLDVKEAGKPAAPRIQHARMPRHPGMRVVTGARALSPPLGDRMTCGDLAGRPVFVRELLPQDLKIEIESMTDDAAREVARRLGGVLGQAHARQLSRGDARAWARQLGVAPGLVAPWLWAGVVDLLGVHEAAYLEHCMIRAKLAR